MRDHPLGTPRTTMPEQRGTHVRCGLVYSNKHPLYATVGQLEPLAYVELSSLSAIEALHGLREGDFVAS